MYQNLDFIEKNILNLFLIWLKVSHISSLGQSVIMMGGGPTAKFFKGVSAELANLWKHKQIRSKRFNISFQKKRMENTILKKQKKIYTFKITILKSITAWTLLKRKRNYFLAKKASIIMLLLRKGCWHSFEQFSFSTFLYFLETP